MMSDAAAMSGGKIQKTSSYVAESTMTSASNPSGIAHLSRVHFAGRCAPTRREEPDIEDVENVAHQWRGATERDHWALRNRDAKRLLHNCRTLRAQTSRAVCKS